MRFAQVSVQSFAQAAAAVFSFQAKSSILIADIHLLLLGGSAIVQASDPSNLFSSRGRTSTTSKNSNHWTEESAKTSPSGSSNGGTIAVPLVPDDDTTSSSEKTEADVGILFLAHAKRSDVEGKKITKMMTRPRSGTAIPYQQVADAGILFPSPHAQTDESSKGTTSIASSNALLTPMMSQQIMAPPCGNAGVVDCFNGQSIKYNYYEGWWYYDGTTCREACNGECCVSSGSILGYHACDGFNGTICRDGSCSGESACRFANIAYVVNSCVGNGACSQKKGQNAQVNGRVINSCRGEYACQLIGNSAQVGGSVSYVKDSCVGDVACVALGMFGYLRGGLTYSCNGYNACFGLGYNGTIWGDIDNSCNSPMYACVQLAIDGAIGNVLNSCNDVEACRSAGSIYCTDVAYNYFGYEVGCSEYSGGGIFTCMKNCCNEKYACNFTKEESLPEQCWTTPQPTHLPTAKPSTKTPTRQPTKKPTSSPTKLPTKKPTTPTKLPTKKPTTPTKLPTKKPTNPTKMPT